MPPYETAGFDPPAPVILGRVLGPTGIIAFVPLLIDTGADVSIVPLNVATAVGAEVFPATISVEFYSGRPLLLSQSVLTVSLLRYRFRGAYLIADAEHGIVGRNILNSLVLSMNGPRLFWDLAPAGG